MITLKSDLLQVFSLEKFGENIVVRAQLHEKGSMASQLGLMLRLARIQFLGLGFMLYLFGYLVAVLGGAWFDSGKFAFGYVILGLAQLSVSFSNDYFDRSSDTHSTKTAFSGGSKVLIEHPELIQPALKIAVALLSLSMICTIVFTFAHAYSSWFLVFGISGGLLGWFYSAPPLRLAYRGLGEVATTLAVGVLMPGIGYFTAAGLLDQAFLVLLFPLTCYAFFFILAVELPDIDSDRIAHKVNIPVKWGKKASLYLSGALAILGSVFLIIIHLSRVLDGYLDLSLIILLSVLPIVAAINALQQHSGRRNAYRQVNITMSAMIVFICAVDLVLLHQFLS